MGAADALQDGEWVTVNSRPAGFFRADYSFDKPVSVRTDTEMERRTGMGANGNASLRMDSIEIRVTPEEKTELRATAERAGLAMTTWARMLLLREARAA
jgi:hypothetical protein